MVKRRQWICVVAVVFGMGPMVGPVTAAQAEPCRCATVDTREFAAPDDPPFTLPYERPDGPLGSGIYAWPLLLVSWPLLLVS